MKPVACLVGLAVVALCVAGAPPGLPPLPVPEDNPQTPEKIALGDKLFHDKRFSLSGEVACANCHAAEKAFTDGPLSVSEGIDGRTGTRNAPTVINAAYFETTLAEVAPSTRRNSGVNYSPPNR
jgi:cytochrome c peroxidase